LQLPRIRQFAAEWDADGRPNFGSSAVAISGLIFAWITAADASGVPLDLCQSGVERGVWPVLCAWHGFERVALGLDEKLLGGAFRDASHRAPEQIG
jgi:hypothetical protein